MEHLKKPDWLKIKLGGNENFTSTKAIIEKHQLHTICSSGKCPNMGECWERGTATFMIGGDICTRSCKFCNTKTGKPGALDLKEPFNVANSIRLMKLRHAVITSVDRDDLPDLGAGHWLTTINEVRRINPETTLEILIPDFRGDMNLIDAICQTNPDIISHNIETVRRLTPEVRSAAKYETSLSVLERIAKNEQKSKSGIMLGLGETRAEVLEALDDLIAVNCQILSIGQYLQPSKAHLPVIEYVHPSVFSEYKVIALNKGFKHVESGPLVRSSYHSENALR